MFFSFIVSSICYTIDLMMITTNITVKITFRISNTSRFPKLEMNGQIMFTILSVFGTKGHSLGCSANRKHN